MTTPPSAGIFAPYEATLDALLARLSPALPRQVARDDAFGLVAAQTVASKAGLPGAPLARIDGWACRALDLVGASAMAPVMLTRPPAWVQAGQPLPAGCDAVFEPGLAQGHGPLCEVMAEAWPGQGVIRQGEVVAAGAAVIVAGRRLQAVDLALAGQAGIQRIACHVPRVRLVDVSDRGQPGTSAGLVRAWLTGQGAQVSVMATPDRGQGTLAGALAGDADLVVVVGGTGQGRDDATAAAIAGAGALIAHPLALAPGPGAAIGWLSDHPVPACPVIALPGLPDQALALCLALLHPVLTRLTGRALSPPLRLPLLRKISSAVGMAELALLQRRADGWLPLGVGQLTLAQFRQADGWLMVASGDEGWPEGQMLAAALMDQG